MLLILQMLHILLTQDKSISISQLISGKSRDLQKLVKYFNGTATSAFNVLLLFGVLPINFFLYSKYLLFYCFIVTYLIISRIIFTYIIIYFVFVTIPQTS